MERTLGVEVKYLITITIVLMASFAWGFVMHILFGYTPITGIGAAVIGFIIIALRHGGSDNE